MSDCAGCHGRELAGGAFATALTGDKFRDKWASIGRDGLTKYISQTMPPADPGGLSQAAYAKLANLIWSANGLKAEAATGADAPAKAAVSEEFDVSSTSSGPNEDAIYREVTEARAKKAASIKPVNDEALRNPSDDDWVQWRRTDDGQGFSPLDQINRSNVDRLSLAWAKPLPAGTNEITPLVRDGVMFLHSDDTVMAVDVKTGQTLWRQVRKLEVKIYGPPFTQTKSLAMFENLLYVPTLDNHVIALDIHTGKVVWDRAVSDNPQLIRMAGGPIVVHDKVIQGTGSCVSLEATRRCFIVALDARTGDEVWRFYTIPLKGEPGGDTWNGSADDKRAGGGVWTAGSYDPVTDLVYFGTGQTYHAASLIAEDGSVSKANAGLYTDTTLALDPDTGKLVWHFQHMRRDVWDLDWPFERTIFDGVYKGKKRRIVATVGKIGILDALDAKTGKYLFSYDIGFQTLVTAIDPVTGRKTIDPAAEPMPGRTSFICPYPLGVRNWPAGSYDARRGLLYMHANPGCMTYSWDKGAPDIDMLFTLEPDPNADGKYGGITAIDVMSRKPRWTKRFRAPMVSAILATAGDLVFAGGRDRLFRAFDSDSGELLWKAQLDHIVGGSPISFAEDGTQYIAVVAGGGHANEILRGPLTPEVEPDEKGTTLWVFALSNE